MADEVTVSKWRFYNSLIGVIIFAFILFVVWKHDTEYVIFLALENIASLQVGFVSLIPKLFLVLVLFVFFKVAIYIFVDVFMHWLYKLYKGDFNIQVITTISKILLWVAFIVSALVVLFEDAGTIITSLGLVGFGITFALQKPILNFVGWLTINFKEIYKVGDRIKIGGVRGDVASIGVMNTEIYGLMDHFDIRNNKVVTVPNEIVLTGEVENYAKESNYLREDLAISITYESDFERAKKILYDISLKVTKENKKHLKTTLKKERKTIEKHLVQLGRELVKSPFGRKREIRKEMKELKEEEKRLDTQAEELDEKYQPKIRMEMLDSAVSVICQFITPYDRINWTKTRINTLFLEKAKKTRTVEIAYPHMELVFNKTTKRLKKR